MTWLVERHYAHSRAPEVIQCLDETAAREVWLKKAAQLHSGRVVVKDADGRTVLKAVACG